MAFAVHDSARRELTRSGSCRILRHSPIGQSGRANSSPWLRRFVGSASFVVPVQHPPTKVKASVSSHKSILVAQELMKAIRSSAYGVGDRLPPERSLPKLMGVSRAAVREALCALQVVGVVESYVGDGTYVRSHRGPAEHDIGRPDATLGRMASAIERFDIDAYLRADLVVHTALAASSRNATLDRTASCRLASMQRRLWKTLKRNDSTHERLLKNAHIRHSRIVDALRGRDADEMTHAMQAHFRFLNDELEDS